MLIYLFWFLFMTLLNLNQADLSDIRLIASDVDGTLTDNGKFSSDFISTLLDLQSSGIKVLLVTGRSAGWVSALVNYLPVAGAIAENGGVFLQPDGQQDLLSSIPNSSINFKARLDASNSTGKVTM